MFVTRSKYDALHARYVEVLAQRDDARKNAKEASDSVIQLAASIDRTGHEASTGRALLAQIRASRSLARRLIRAVEACARYRDDAAALRHQLAQVQAAYDHSVGLDSPALDMGVHWQQRRSDRVVPKAVES